MAPEKVFVNGARKSAVAGVEVADQERLLSPAMALEKVLDTCRSHVRWETPRGRYDECSSKFSLRETLPQRNSEVVNLTGLLIPND